MKYDYFVAGRWRNHIEIRKILEAIRKSGRTAYCFIDNSYHGDGIEIDNDPNADAENFMKGLESIENWQTNATFKQIYENDMNGIKDSNEFVLVFPAGLSAHMELGVAFGMGKTCFGIGKPSDKHETLYLMFDKIFTSAEAFLNAQDKALV
jgi:hypothetical protein